MRELEASLQQFGEFILKARLVQEKATPYCVRWVRQFLTRPASDEPLAIRYADFARISSAMAAVTTGRSARPNTPSASTSSTFSNGPTGSASRPVRSSMNAATRAH